MDFSQINNADPDKLKLMNKALDFEYVKMTTIIVILIVLLFYMTCRFGFGIKKQSDQSPPTPSTPASASNNTKTESFAPYVSIQTRDIKRSDTQFDYGEILPGRSSEDYLFNQIDGWVSPAITPKAPQSVDPSKFAYLNIPQAQYSPTATF